MKRNLAPTKTQASSLIYGLRGQSEASTPLWLLFFTYDHRLRTNSIRSAVAAALCRRTPMRSTTCQALSHSCFVFNCCCLVTRSLKHFAQSNFLAAHLGEGSGRQGGAQ